MKKEISFGLTLVLAVVACGPFGSIAHAAHKVRLGKIVVSSDDSTKVQIPAGVFTHTQREDGEIPLIVNLSTYPRRFQGLGKWDWRARTHAPIFGTLPPVIEPVTELLKGEYHPPELVVSVWSRQRGLGPPVEEVGWLRIPLVDGVSWKGEFVLGLPGGTAKGVLTRTLRIENDCVKVIGVLEMAKKMYKALKEVKPEPGEDWDDYGKRVVSEAETEELRVVPVTGPSGSVHVPGYAPTTPFSPSSSVMSGDFAAGIPSSARQAVKKSLEDMDVPEGEVAVRRAAEILRMEQLIRALSKWLSENGCDAWR